MPVAQRLSDEDLSILALENATVAGHTCKVILVQGQLDAAQLRSSIAGRLDRAPRLRWRLAEVGKRSGGVAASGDALTRAPQSEIGPWRIVESRVLRGGDSSTEIAVPHADCE